MKKILSLALSVIILFTAVFSVGAENYSYNNSSLFNKYSPSEILDMYPDLTKHIAEELRKYNTDIDVRGYNVSVNDIGAIFFSIICENPDIFYVSASQFESTSESDTGILVSLRPEYIYDINTIPGKIEELEKAADFVLSGVSGSWTDMYKCRYLHDMIAQYVHYDMDIYNTDPSIRTAYGALINNNAVCEGYTSAYNYLLGKLGIEAHYVQSLKMEHAWSMVKLGKKYYHVDITYDDPSYDNLGNALHFYCIVSDAELKKDGVHHDWIGSIKADDTSFDKVWWRNVNTFIFPIDGYDYYMNQNYGSSVYGALIQRNIQTGNERAVEKIYTRWNVEENSSAFWERAYCFLTYDGNYLYYNDNEGVYRHKPDNSSYFDVLYKKPAALKNNIYGIALNMESKLFISIKESPNVEDVVYYVDKNVMNQNFETEDTPGQTKYNEVEGGIEIYKFADDSENIVIPNTIDGKKVVSIGANTFSDRQNLKSIIIPEGVTSIGDSAFYNCPNLKSVILPDSVKSIGLAAFSGCSSIDEITIPESVTKIGKNAFAGCINITIKGYKNSTAEVYAQYYGIHFSALSEPEPVTEPTTTAPKKETKPVYSQKQSMYVLFKGKVSGLGSNIKCTSSNKSVATVTSQGVISAKKKGKAVIKIEGKNYIYNIKLTVKNPKLNKTKKTLKPGSKFTLKVIGKAGRTTFKSSNKRIASVNSKGKITAKKKGKITITVKTNGKVKLKCKVTVK